MLWLLRLRRKHYWLGYLSSLHLDASCPHSLIAVMYVMTAGAAAVRRLQGGGAAAMPGGLPGAGAGMAAATRSEGGMFAAKEYSKVRRRHELWVTVGHAVSATGHK